MNIDSRPQARLLSSWGPSDSRLKHALRAMSVNFTGISNTQIPARIAWQLDFGGGLADEEARDEDTATEEEQAAVAAAQDVSGGSQFQAAP